MKGLTVLILSFSVVVGSGNALAQGGDTIPTVSIPELLIKGYQSIGGVTRMADVEENTIYAGKKNEVLLMSRLNADLSTNNARQVFAKVPGISIWENDGSGIQVGVATRGLSPNRSWEFNVRQNGYDISSEAFGYPESYYSPPMEALDKIEVIRGAASLQYGPQFGGLLNYKLKKGHPTKVLTFESQQTVGSYGLFNTFNALGGTYKKWNYYGFIHHRAADGWRQNSHYATLTAHLSLGCQVTSKLSIGLEYTKNNYKSQQSGGLTETQYAQNHQQSSRSRNWFGAPWNVASALVKYKFTDDASLQIKSFMTLAERNSVGFTKAINVKDSINPATQQYAPRQVDCDEYQNYGSEARLSLTYKFINNQQHTLATGVRAYLGKTNRNQLGVGTTASDFNLSLTDPTYGRSLQFKTINYAAFAENIFQLGSRLKVIPGIRLEYLNNQVEGYINTTTAGAIAPNTKTRQIFLYGLGAEFNVTKTTNLYANYSRAYRPVTFSELTPSATTEVIDPDLKDASGFNADLGYRGTIKNLVTFDLSAFYLRYENRIGSLNQNGTPFKTNIGTSESKGIEVYIEVSPLRFLTSKKCYGELTLFTSNSFIQAQYTQWLVPATTIENNRIENAPQYTHRLGATYCLKGFSASFNFSSVGDVFTDAANSETPNATATIGKLAAYQVMDLSLSYHFLQRFNLKAGVNNLTDEKYATRRATGYPGPGILPGNGQTFYLSFGANF